MANFWSQQVEPLFLLQRAVKWLATLGGGLICFIGYLLFTTTGTKTALFFISDFTPYEVKFSDVSGSFIDHLDFKDLQLRGPTFYLQAKQLSAGWDWRELLKKEKRFHYLQSEQLELTLTHTKAKLAQKKSPLATLQDTLYTLFPVPWQIDNIHIKQASVQWEQQTHIINEFSIKNASSELSRIAEIHYQGALGSLHAYLQNAIKVDWDIQYSKPLAGNFTLNLMAPHFSSHGHIYLPSGKLDDPKNQMTMEFHTQEYPLPPYHLQNVSFYVKGTLADHQARFKAVHQKTPVDLQVSGKFLPQQWQGKIEHIHLPANLAKFGDLKGDVLLDWQQKTLFTQMKLFLGDYPLQLQANIHKARPYSLSGTLQANIPNIHSLAKLFPDLKQIEGKLNLDATLAGTLDKPTISGQALLQNGKIYSPILKSRAYIDTLRVALSEKNQLKLNGEGSWGKGRFIISGDGLISQSNPQITINFKGENLLLSNTPEYFILAHPDLKLTLKSGAPPFLTGKVVIPQAQIQLLNNPDMVTPSHDVVIVTAHQTPAKALQERSFSTRIASEIDIILEDKIIYKGYGFSSNVSGKLQVKQQSDQLPLAKGKLILQNGKYRAYGKIFDISAGEVIFTGGPIYDPILDIRVQRQIQPRSKIPTLQGNQLITAGIKFSGHVKAPDITFYSVPTMPDTDVISYLVVGRPQSQVNEAQAELLFQAVSQLAGFMSNSRKDVQLDIADRLKLDQFGFAKKANAPSIPGHNPLENTVFILGKQLSDRLYLHYSVGILDSASNLGLRYLLHRNITIEAAAGTDGPSADVLLSFEGH